MKERPSREPVRPPVWDPNVERYWDPRDLESELVRTFQICHECRMCVTYCGSFPILFDAIDKQVDAGRAEGAEQLTSGTFHEVVDHCWQCKLCYIKCPYTADEGARELVDFPRLMAREKAQRARRDGIPIVDRILGEPQLIGWASSGVVAPLVNFVNRDRLLRRVTEKATGISADFPLPPLARQPFERWFSEHPKLPSAGIEGEVVLFPTCYGDYNFPEVPRAAVQVLEKNGYSVLLPLPRTCCGMPNLDGGDVEAAKLKMEKNVAALIGHVRAGRKVVVPGPTCGYTMKKEWPTYVGTADAALVAANTLDLMEFVDGLRRRGKLNKDFRKPLGKVVYHAACHLRAQKVAIPGARVLSQLPSTTVRVVERCSAVDGTWGMKAAYYEEGARYGKRLTRALDGADKELVVSDCSLAALRIFKEKKVWPAHPVEALAYAYALDEPAQASSPAPLETEAVD